MSWLVDRMWCRTPFPDEELLNEFKLTLGTKLFRDFKGIWGTVDQGEWVNDRNIQFGPCPHHLLWATEQETAFNRISCTPLEHLLPQHGEIVIRPGRVEYVPDEGDVEVIYNGEGTPWKAPGLNRFRGFQNLVPELGDYYDCE